MNAWIVSLPAAAVAGVAAAWVSARLTRRPEARGPGPARRLVALMVAGALAAAGCSLIWRPDEAGASFGLGWTLLVLASVDLAVFRLPDLLTLPLAAAGLLWAWLTGADPGGHLAGLVAGYLAIAAVGWAFERLRGRRGIGLGDAKLLAAAGAWLGWAALPSVVLIACGLGLAWYAAATLRRGRRALSAAIPFGAPLCCAAWLVWLGR